MRIWTATWCAAFLVSLASLAAADRGEDAEVLLRKAKNEELVNGDLAAAMTVYQRILDEHGDHRPLVAQALFRIGQCHERLGQTEARKAYTKLVREFPDQTELASLAQKRLEALTAAAGELATERLIWASPDAIAAFISKDGGRLSFVNWMSYSVGLRDLGGGQSRVVVDASRQGYCDAAPVLSPDGKRIVFNWFQNGWKGYGLRIAGSDGSGVEDLYRNDEVRWMAPFDWSTDGELILALFERQDRTQQIAVVSTKDGAARFIKSLDWSGTSNIKFSPNSHAFAYHRNVQSSPNRPPNNDIFILDFEQNRETHLVQHPANDKLLGWTPDGTMVVFSSDRRGSRDVWAAEISNPNEPTLVKKGLADVRPVGFAPDGSFYYSTVARPRDVYVATVDRKSGKVVVPTRKVSRLREGGNMSPDWSPDGRQLAYVRFRSQPSITILTPETEEYRELYTNLSYIYGKGARWAPNGKCFILGGRENNGRRGIYQVNAQTGKTTLIRGEDGNRVGLQPEWTPDGKSIVFSVGRTSHNVRMLNLETKEETIILPDVVTSREPSFALSPDGKSLAFVTHDKQASNLKVLSLGSEDVRLLHQEAPGVLGRIEWSPEGTDVIFEKNVDPTTELWQASMSDGTVRSIGLSARGFNPLLHPRIHPDGRQIAFTASNRGEDEPFSEVWVMENFLPSRLPDASGDK